jgi:hypothetical protein
MLLVTVAFAAFLAIWWSARSATRRRFAATGSLDRPVTGPLQGLCAWGAFVSGLVLIGLLLS